MTRSRTPKAAKDAVWIVVGCALFYVLASVVFETVFQHGHPWWSWIFFPIGVIPFCWLAAGAFRRTSWAQRRHATKHRIPSDV